ncbi:MFS general substrate transporter [Terfezia boudieri ATCC MYA-4762]|uniref:MFS general substrate transporter n=1 Tax=Terfezia boudieri ATCC MYA-4762 TaxID=1051890 RepID=A0A3N4M128_9PEZI|nr:MFS general substrate transporter [Terfezia boudieri ATCC MYA-4762]
MGLGILDDRKLDKVPGTVVLVKDVSQAQDGPIQIDTRLKYDLSGPNPVLLVPQPSDDPNDPLNWPLWKRDVMLVLLCLESIIAVSLGPILAANALTILLVFRTGISGVALLTGYHLCGVGVAGLLFVASARIWGTRHLYLLGGMLLVASSIWGALATSYKSFLWARILQGVAVCPFEALVNVSVGDMYPVHQRGMRMALSNLSLYGGAFFTPVIVGITSDRIGWRWTFWLVVIFGGVLFPFIVFFVPETAYRRPAYLNLDISSKENLNALDMTESGFHSSNEEKFDDVDVLEHPAPEKDSFLKTLLPFNGRKTDDTFWKVLFRPLPLIFHPAVFWGMLTQGTLIGWTVMIGVDIAWFYRLYPVNFNPAETGYSYAGGFFGGLVGFVLSGLLSDWSAKYLTRLNKGVYEPEFRIVLVILQMIFGCLGLFGFGFTTNNLQKYPVGASIFFFAIEVMGMVIGAVASALYIVDAHRNISIEAFTCLLLFKNFFSFGITWIAWDWVIKEGVWKNFRTVGLIQVGVCLLSIPMYILGKKNRSLMHRHNILEILGLTDRPILGSGDTLIESRARLRRMKVQQENVEWNERMRQQGRARE